MQNLLDNLSKYRYLWQLEQPYQLGEPIFKYLVNRIRAYEVILLQLKTENDALKQEILQLKERGKT